jgi:hypothetical protein
VISFASTPEFRPESIALGRRERRQKAKPITKTRIATTPAITPAIALIFEESDDEDLIKDATQSRI